ncbi:hypothetical protein DXG01_011648 [Tephrocybe rancida]|nr:hypothetical protein DXG01_011648 [Tephrocybe rancida]
MSVLLARSLNDLEATKEDGPIQADNVFSIFKACMLGNSLGSIPKNRASDAELRLLMSYCVLNVQCFIDGSHLRPTMVGSVQYHPKLFLNELNDLRSIVSSSKSVLAAHFRKLKTKALRQKGSAPEELQKPSASLLVGLYSSLARRMQKQGVKQSLINLMSATLHLACLLKGSPYLPLDMDKIEMLFITKETESIDAAELQRLRSSEIASSKVAVHHLQNTLFLALITFPLLVLLPLSFNELSGKEVLLKVPSENIPLLETNQSTPTPLTLTIPSHQLSLGVTSFPVPLASACPQEPTSDASSQLRTPPDGPVTLPSNPGGASPSPLQSDSAAPTATVGPHFVAFPIAPPTAYPVGSGSHLPDPPHDPGAVATANASLRPEPVNSCNAMKLSLAHTGSSPSFIVDPSALGDPYMECQVPEHVDVFLLPLDISPPPLPPPSPAALMGSSADIHGAAVPWASSPTPPAPRGMVHNHEDKPAPSPMSLAPSSPLQPTATLLNSNIPQDPSVSTPMVLGKRETRSSGRGKSSDDKQPDYKEGKAPAKWPKPKPKPKNVKPEQTPLKVPQDLVTRGPLVLIVEDSDPKNDDTPIDLKHIPMFYYGSHCASYPIPGTSLFMDWMPSFHHADDLMWFNELNKAAMSRQKFSLFVKVIEYDEYKTMGLRVLLDFFKMHACILVVNGPHNDQGFMLEALSKLMPPDETVTLHAVDLTHVPDLSTWDGCLGLIFLCVYFELHSAIYKWCYDDPAEDVQRFKASIKSRARACQLIYLFFSTHTLVGLIGGPGADAMGALSGAHALNWVYVALLAHHARLLVLYKENTMENKVFGERPDIGTEDVRCFVDACIAEGPAEKLYAELAGPKDDPSFFSFSWNGPSYSIHRMEPVKFDFPYFSGHVYSDCVTTHHQGINLHLEPDGVLPCDNPKYDVVLF